MPFSPIIYSQQDPSWKTVKLGKSSETIGHVGCALTSVSMLVSGYGYPESPKTLNSKLKSRGGFVGAAIIWGAVTHIYPQIIYRNLVLCRDIDAPLTKINASLAAGQPVLIEVINSPSPGLQTHWVVLYEKKGKDYLMLDPWPYPTENGQIVKLMPRYSQGGNLKQSISAVVFYECLQIGSGASSIIASTKPILPEEVGTYITIPVSVEAGLRLRSGPTTGTATIAIEPPGANLRVVEPVEVATPKIGVFNQWIHVQDQAGRQGYVAAWYVEKGPSIEPSNETDSTTPVPARVKTGELIIYVSGSVGTSGLRLRKAPSTGGELVAVEKAGTVLTVLEPAQKVKPKIGVEGKWIHVSDPSRRKGYVAAKYVGLEPLPADRLAPTGFKVFVDETATAGLRLRSGPSMNSSALMILEPESELTVLEGTIDMIGEDGKWFKVREFTGKEGFVAAWYVHK